MHTSLYKARKDARETQYITARSIELSVKQYGLKERGVVAFSLDETFALSKHFKCSISTLFPEYFLSEMFH